MAEIRNLTRNGETFYPLTHAEAVSDPDGEYIGYYVDNPEWSRVIADHEGKILLGIKKDGSVEWSIGVPLPIKTYILEDIVPNLEDEINGKVDKEEGKAIIDSTFASSIYTIENAEYLTLTTDSENRIIGGIKRDGSTKYDDSIKKLETSLMDCEKPLIL